MRTMCFYKRESRAFKTATQIIKVFPEKSLSLIVIMLTYHIKVSDIYLYISSYLLQIGLIGLFGQTVCNASGCDDIIFLTIKRLCYFGWGYFKFNIQLFTYCTSQYGLTIDLDGIAT